MELFGVTHGHYLQLVKPELPLGSALDSPEQLAFKEFGEDLGAGLAWDENLQAREDSSSQVSLNSIEKVLSEVAHEIDVVFWFDLAIPSLLQKSTNRQVVVGANYGTTGNARDDLNSSQ